MDKNEFLEVRIQKALEMTFGPENRRLTPCSHCRQLVRRTKFQEHLLRAHGIEFSVPIERRTNTNVLPMRKAKSVAAPHPKFAKAKGFGSNTTKFTKSKTNPKSKGALSRALSGQFESKRSKH
jgi:hypothetical protein